MATYVAVVIADAALAHQREIARNVAANVARQLGAVTDPHERARRVQQITSIVASRIGAPRAVGTLHTVAALECPEGGVNCRNCGDPKHAERCAAAGHCPHCGTRHGVAPDRIVAANGYRLQPLAAPPRDDQMWDVSTARFVARPPAPPRT